MKKTIKIISIILFILITIWFGFELVNYLEYASASSRWDKNTPQENLWMPRPGYSPIFIRIISEVFHFSNDDTGLISYKPVIYLYPNDKQDVLVQLDYDGKIIADYPDYNYSIKGWEVTAFPDGHLINHADNKEYSYLFWEGIGNKKAEYDLSKGFIVKGSDTKEFLQRILEKIGLTPKEYNEFIVYWYPRMKDNRYNLVHFTNEEYTNTAKLSIIPKPDSLLRVFMVFKPLQTLINITPQDIKAFKRTGFSVVEWGGTEIE
ncbi:MAG: hypothetical protein PHV47_01125 [Candidatus Pacebacteria bacterium]|nr:hypothetical protein [Candidatus Paceibacterota bacterium]